MTDRARQVKIDEAFAHLTSGSWSLKLPVYDQIGSVETALLENLFEQELSAIKDETPGFYVDNGKIRARIENCLELYEFGEDFEKSGAARLLKALIAKSLPAPELEAAQQTLSKKVTSGTASPAPNVAPKGAGSTSPAAFAKNEQERRPAAPQQAQKPPVDQAPDQQPKFREDPLEPFGEYSAKRIVVTLPAEDGAQIGPGEILLMPALLPPPPPEGDEKMFTNTWLEGKPWHTLSIGIGVINVTDVSEDDFTEMQSEFYSSAQTAYKMYSARPLSKAEPKIRAGEALIACGRDLGAYGTNFQKAGEDLGAAMLDHFEMFEPQNAEFIRKSGLQITIGERMADVIASVRDIEDHFLGDGPANPEQGPAQGLRGSITPQERLDRPIVLQRALQMHLSAGQDFCQSMQAALLELRQAQLTRATGLQVETSRFDRVMAEDWFMPLRDLAGKLKVSEEPVPAP